MVTEEGKQFNSYLKSEQRSEEITEQYRSLEAYIFVYNFYLMKYIQLPELQIQVGFRESAAGQRNISEGFRN